MYSPNKVVASLVVTVALMSPVLAYDFGRRATPEEIKLWDIEVRPDGKGLPEGSGTVAHGKQVFEENCSACHGEAGQGGIKDRLVGGQGTLASDMPVKTVGSFWPYATTLFDYVHRAMPYQAPGSLSVDDTYAVVAYILSLNGINSADGKLDKASLPLVKMPNRDGFIPEAEFGPSRQPERNEMAVSRSRRQSRSFRVDCSDTADGSASNGRRWADHDQERFWARRNHEPVRGRSQGQGHDGVCPYRSRGGRGRSGLAAAADRSPDLRQCEGRHATDAIGPDDRDRPAAQGTGLAG
jgi:cytochrome c